MLSDDATSVRELAVAQYYDDLGLEVACLSQVRGELRICYDNMIRDLRRSLETSPDDPHADQWRDQLKRLEKQRDEHRYYLEGIDEKIYCLELVKKRRRLIGMLKDPSQP